MQTLHCHGDWLLDYADGALPPPQLAAAEQHLSHCPVCRREVAALQTSGEQLSGYFATLRASTNSLPLPPGERVGVRGLVSNHWTSVAQRVVAVAACLALVAMGYWLNRQARVDVRPVEIVQHEPTPRETSKETPQSVDHDEIAAEIARETQIARLRAAIAILKDEPGMSERSAALQQYLSEAYQVDLELPAM